MNLLDSMWYNRLQNHRKYMENISHSYLQNNFSFNLSLHCLSDELSILSYFLFIYLCLPLITVRTRNNNSETFSSLQLQKIKLSPKCSNPMIIY